MISKQMTPLLFSLLASLGYLSSPSAFAKAEVETSRSSLSGSLMFGYYQGHINADAELDSAAQLTLRLHYFPTRYWGLEAGLNQPSSLSTTTESDNAGRYQLTFDSDELMLGVSGKWPIDNTWNLLGSVGLLYYDMEIGLEESFYDYKPSGSDKTDDNGTGYYAAAGVRRHLKGNWSIDAQTMHFMRQDVMGDSRKPFDLSSTGASIGVALYF